MSRREWEKLIRRLTREAESGRPEAQWELASWLEDGLRDWQGKVLVAADVAAAVAWHRRSAELGFASAQNALGVHLSNGTGTKRNNREALLWLKRALRQGDSCAPNNIACIYRDLGNSRRALYWYSRAAKSGDGDALIEVGFRHYDGTGTKRNAVYALKCFRKGIRDRGLSISEAGREKAMFGLATAYHEGKGVTRSDILALKWLMKANKDDDFPAARELIEVIVAKGEGKNKLRRQ